MNSISSIEIVGFGSIEIIYLGVYGMVRNCCNKTIDRKRTRDDSVFGGGHQEGPIRYIETVAKLTFVSLSSSINRILAFLEDMIKYCRDSRENRRYLFVNGGSTSPI